MLLHICAYDLLADGCLYSHYASGIVQTIAARLEVHLIWMQLLRLHRYLLIAMFSFYCVFGHYGQYDAHGPTNSQ